tara:strand:+ start:3046 stop:3426 length:381 start_codon:yes stop_codon:yes gene_type:complete
MHDFLSGLAAGIILLQTAVFAPTIFTTIDMEPAGKLLRALFPKFFKLLIAIGVLMFITLIVSYQGTTIQFTIAGLTILFPLICASLVPMTNRATDSGDKARFKLLHSISVILTIIVFIANIAMPWV